MLREWLSKRASRDGKPRVIRVKGGRRAWCCGEEVVLIGDFGGAPNNYGCDVCGSIYVNSPVGVKFDKVS